MIISVTTNQLSTTCFKSDSLDRQLIPTAFTVVVIRVVVRGAVVVVVVVEAVVVVGGGRGEAV